LGRQAPEPLSWLSKTRYKKKWGGKRSCNNWEGSTGGGHRRSGSTYGNHFDRRIMIGEVYFMKRMRKEVMTRRINKVSYIQKNLLLERKT